MKDNLVWNPGKENVARKAMVEHSLALMERIRKVVVSKACLPTSLTNGVHLDIRDLKAKEKLTRIHSTSLHIIIICYRQN